MSNADCSLARFWVAGAPATKGSWKVTRGKLRPDNQRERPWANAVAWTAQVAKVPRRLGAVHVTIEFFFPKPKKPTNAYPARNDVDKLGRSVLDALIGIAWVDDSQVTDLHVTKAFADDRGPGALVTIGALS